MFSKGEEICARALLYCITVSAISIGLYYLFSGVQLVVALVLVIILVSAVYNYTQGQYFFHIVLVLCITALCSLVWVKGYELKHSYTLEGFGEKISFTGVVSRVPDRRFDKQFISVTPNGEEYRVRIRLKKDERYSIGDIVTVSGIVKKPQPFETETGAQFDYPTYLRVTNTIAEISFANVTKEGNSGKYPVQRFLSEVNISLQERLKKFLYYDSYPLALGTVLGSQEYFDDTSADIFRVAGLSHIVVLSGFNISLVALLLQGLFSQFSISRKYQLIMVVLGIWIFVSMVGFSPSIMRAAVMASIGISAIIFKRESAGLRTLLYASIVMILCNPRILVYDIGFQLSISATFGMIVIVPLVTRLLFRESNPSAIAETIISTLSASLATLPIMLFKLGSLSGLSILSNIAVVWMVGYLMLTVALLGIFGNVLYVGKALSIVVHIGTSYITTIAEYIARITPATIKANSVLLLASMCCVGCIFYFRYRFINRNKGFS